MAHHRARKRPHALPRATLTDFSERPKVPKVSGIHIRSRRQSVLDSALVNEKLYSSSNACHRLIGIDISGGNSADVVRQVSDSASSAVFPTRHRPHTSAGRGYKEFHQRRSSSSSVVRFAKSTKPTYYVIDLECRQHCMSATSCVGN